MASGKHMSKRTLQQLQSAALYLFIYAHQKQGKSVLPLTLSKHWGKTDIPPEQRGSDVAYVTCEPHGPLSCIRMGYKGVEVDVPDALAQLPKAQAQNNTKVKEMTTQIVNAIGSYAMNPNIRVIVVDGLYTYAAKYVSSRSKDGTDKGMGFDGWGELKAGMHDIENACVKAVEKGKHVVMTSWCREPVYKEEKTLAGTGGATLQEPGRPLLPGEAKDWMPGQCDAVLRLNSFMKKGTEGGKVVHKFHGELQINPTEEYIAGNRWHMPELTVPADLRIFAKAMQE
jgi:hypothetical protein